MTDSQANTPSGGDPATTEAAASRVPVRLPPPPPAGRSSRAGGERLPMLDVVLERLGKTLQASLRRLAGDGISVVIDPPASLRMGEYLMQLPSPALLCIARLEGTNAPGLVVAGADLVFSAVELFLGGRPLPAEARPDRPFSAVERTLAEHRDKLEEADASTIEGRIMELKQAVEGSDVTEIRAKTEALETASRSLADAIYAQASAQATTSPASGNGDAAEDEVVEDADFEVIDEEEAAKS
jgi:hypothetical protein